jgi:hypothetical protein
VFRNFFSSGSLGTSNRIFFEVKRGRLLNRSSSSVGGFRNMIEGLSSASQRLQSSPRHWHFVSTLQTIQRIVRVLGNVEAWRRGWRELRVTPETPTRPEKVFWKVVYVRLVRKNETTDCLKRVEKEAIDCLKELRVCSNRRATHSLSQMISSRVVALCSDHASGLAVCMTRIVPRFLLNRDADHTRLKWINTRRAFHHVQSLFFRQDLV